MQGDQGAVELSRGARLELLEAHVADTLVEHAALDGFDVDDFASQLERTSSRPASGTFAGNSYGHFRARVSAEPSDRVVQRHVEGGFVADLLDAVVTLQPSPSCGRTWHGLDDRQHLVTDRNDDANATECALGGDGHLLVRLGAEEHGVRVEGVEHAVARRVFDLSQIDLGGILQVFLQKREDFPELGRYVPRPLHVAHIELLLVRSNPYRDLILSGVPQDDDLGDVPLDEVEGGQQHLLGFHAVWIDVLVANGLDRGGYGLELGEVVGGLDLPTAAGCDGVGWLDSVPKATGPKLEGEIGGEAKRAEKNQELDEAFETTHVVKDR